MASLKELPFFVIAEGVRSPRRKDSAHTSLKGTARRLTRHAVPVRGRVGANGGFNKHEENRPRPSFRIANAKINDKTVVMIEGRPIETGEACTL